MRTCARDDCRQGAGLIRKAEGITIDGAWFCSPGCVEGFARERLSLVRPAADVPRVDPLRMRLGAWLRHDGSITADQLAVALEAQRETGLKLGAQLCALGFASTEAVLRGLARQAGIRYLTRVELSGIRRGPAGLSRHIVRALMLVPFCEPSQGLIRVACAAPIPRVALSALRTITGLAPEPYLVTDEFWRDLLEAYGADAAETMAAYSTATQDAGTAAASIARAATTARAARLTETRWAPYTWVRVQAPTSVHDVVLADPKGR